MDFPVHIHSLGHQKLTRTAGKRTRAQAAKQMKMKFQRGLAAFSRRIDENPALRVFLTVASTAIFILAVPALSYVSYLLGR